MWCNTYRPVTEATQVMHAPGASICIDHGPPLMVLCSDTMDTGDRWQLKLLGPDIVLQSRQGTLEALVAAGRVFMEPRRGPVVVAAVPIAALAPAAFPGQLIMLQLQSGVCVHAWARDPRDGRVHDTPCVWNAAEVEGQLEALSAAKALPLCHNLEDEWVPSTEWAELARGDGQEASVYLMAQTTEGALAPIGYGVVHYQAGDPVAEVSLLCARVREPWMAADARGAVLLRMIRDVLPAYVRVVELTSVKTAVGFYQRQGFEVVGPHFRMASGR